MDLSGRRLLEMLPVDPRSSVRPPAPTLPLALPSAAPRSPASASVRRLSPLLFLLGSSAATRLASCAAPLFPSSGRDSTCRSMAPPEDAWPWSRSQSRAELSADEEAEEPAPDEVPLTPERAVPTMLPPPPPPPVISFPFFLIDIALVLAALPAPCE